MPGFKNALSYVGNTPPDNLFVPTTEQKFELGQILVAHDSYWGYGEFVYGKAVAAQITGELVYPSTATFTMTALPSTANLGKPFLVAKQEMAINTFGWYQKCGLCAVASSADVAADAAAGIGTAGKVGAYSTGKGLLGIVIRGANAFTIAKTGVTQVQVGKKKIIRVADNSGWFVGLTLSGTGIPASSEITSMDPSGTFVTMSEDATAAGTVTVTGTYTGYLLAYIQNPCTMAAVA